MPEYLEGHFSADDETRFAVVVSRFNEFITERLLEGALDTLRRHGIDLDRVTVARCPGAFELPVVARKLAASGDYAAVLCLGALIRGATSHFDHIASSMASGLQRAALDTDVPVLFGVLTTDTIDQALERAGTKAGNKGAEAARAALEMASLMQRLDTAS